MKVQRGLSGGSGILALVCAIVFFGVSCAAPTASSKTDSPTPIGPGLVAQYDFESVGSGTLAAVAGSRPLSMTLPLGTAGDTTANQLVAGKVGISALRAGTTYSAKQGGTIVGAFLGPDDAGLTVSAWVKSSSAWSAFFKIGGMWIDLPNLWIPAGAGLSTSHHLTPGGVTPDGDSSWDEPLPGYDPSGLATQNWVHVTVVFDPAVGISFYKDGLRMVTYRISTSGAAADLVNYVLTAAKNPKTITRVAFNGASWDPVVSMDDLRFYNYPLSPAQVADLDGLSDPHDPVATDPVVAASILTVDLSSVIRPVTHAASGSLYGVTETTPANLESLVAPLRPRVFTAPARSDVGDNAAKGTYQQPYGSAIPLAKRLAAAGSPGQVMIRLADLCPSWPYVFPKTAKGDWTLWLAAVGSVIDDKKAAEAQGVNNFYGYEIWNEPVYTWNAGLNGEFFDLWKATYDLIRIKDPTAKIVGPSEGYYSPALMTAFLTFCRDNQCVPDIICWHELASNGGTGPSTIQASISSLRSIEASLGLADLPISINEYCNVNHEYEGAPGPSAPFIAKFERYKVDSACISWWWTATPGRLGSLLGTDTDKNGGWWFYHWYGAMTGSMVNVTAPNEASAAVDGFASIDEEARSASLCFGGVVAGGTVEIRLTGIPAWMGSSVRTIVQTVGWSNRNGTVDQTSVLSNEVRAVENGGVTFSLSGLNKLSGYRVLILPGGAAVPPTAGTFRLVNLNSGKELAWVKGEFVQGGTGAANRWTLVPSGAAFTVTNVSSGVALSDGSTTTWTFTDVGGGVYQLGSGGQAWGVQDQSSLDGAPVVASVASALADQRWILQPAD